MGPLTCSKVCEGPCSEVTRADQPLPPDMSLHLPGLLALRMVKSMQKYHPPLRWTTGPLKATFLQVMAGSCSPCLSSRPPGSQDCASVAQWVHLICHSGKISPQYFCLLLYFVPGTFWNLPHGLCAELSNPTFLSVWPLQVVCPIWIPNSHLKAPNWTWETSYWHYIVASLPTGGGKFHNVWVSGPWDTQDRP